jgi:hypothetical protein
MGPLQDIRETWARFWNDDNPAVAFLHARRRLLLAISAIVLVPCFWHARIEAGDLGSHVYNAWLAQLIAKGQAPGLYTVWQWNNVLFDVALLHAANVFGFAAAQRIVISACVLIFFWGVFALVSAVTGRGPLFLTPCIAMLTYGYSFEMGFINYCLSIGLACLSLALFWSGKGKGWIAGLAIAPFVFLAHPIGFLWLVGTVVYISLRRNIFGWWRIVLPATALAAIFGVRWYLLHRAKFEIDWEKMPFYLSNGADQLPLFGDRYISLAWVALCFGLACFLSGMLAVRRDKEELKSFLLPLELYLIMFFATAMLPENLRPPMFAGWIGLLVSRLTMVSAILGLCVLGCIRPRKWHLAGFGAVAVVFFAFLYQDTGVLNHMESNAEIILSGLPYGTRVIPTIRAPEDSRVQFIGHMIDRACIGHCFTYSNYEPSSRQFRVRVRKGSPLANDSADDAEDMEGGSYEFQQSDLPLRQIYQCDPADRTKLCLRDLAEGDTTAGFGLHPPAAQKPPDPVR